MKIIKFVRMEWTGKCWAMPQFPVVDGIKIVRGEIAIGRNLEEAYRELYRKLDGQPARIEVPAESWWVRLWRNIRPLQAIECREGETYVLDNR